MAPTSRLKKTRYEGVAWIHLAQDRQQRKAVLIMVNIKGVAIALHPG
jgi:hypothetical protein